MTRVAVKFCGGCDPAYDRSLYWEAVKDRAGDRIDWVSLDESGYEAVLLIDGCETACTAEKMETGELAIKGPVRVVSLKSDSLDPAVIVEKLLEAV